MIAKKLTKSTFRSNVPEWAGLLEDKIIETLQVVCVADKEGLKTYLSNLAGDVTVDIIGQGNMDSQLMRNIETFTKSDRFMDALAPRAANGQ